MRREGVQTPQPDCQGHSAGKNSKKCDNYHNDLPIHVSGMRREGVQTSQPDCQGRSAGKKCHNYHNDLPIHVSGLRREGVQTPQPDCQGHSAGKKCHNYYDRDSFCRNARSNYQNARHPGNAMDARKVCIPYDCHPRVNSPQF